MSRYIRPRTHLHIADRAAAAKKTFSTIRTYVIAARLRRRRARFPDRVLLDYRFKIHNYCCIEGGFTFSCKTAEARSRLSKRPHLRGPCTSVM